MNGTFIIGFLVIAIGVVSAAVYNQEQENKKVADTIPNCKYLGHNRDTSRVLFFDCDGQIVMKLKP